MQPVPVILGFSTTNALWSLGLFLVGLAVIVWKMHKLRMEIHALVVGLPRIGSEFIHEELDSIKESLNETRARVRLIEEQIGLNGEDRKE